MSDFNIINNNDFMIEKIKERPINRKKLIRRTVMTASMAVIFGLVACFTILFLEPIISNYLYPEEEAEVITFPEDEEEMKPEDMLEEEIPVVETTPPEPVNAQLDQEQVDEILNAVTLDKNHYVQLYDVMSDYVKELSQYMVKVTGVKEDYDWLANSYESTSDTSGVLIAKNNKDLYILTDSHSLKKADKIQVTFSNGRVREATLIGKHTEMDLAILSINLEQYGTQDEAQQIAVAPLARGQVKTGQPVVALGSPMGITDSIGYGIITAENGETRAVDFNYDLIVTDIYGSQSAEGILFNMEGEMVGVITSAKISIDMRNMITALAVGDLKQMITVLSSGKQVSYLGIKGIGVTKEANTEYQIPYGAYVTDVVMNSPAMLAGLQKGDIIVGMNERVIEDYDDFKKAMYYVSPGQMVTVKLMRQSQDTYKEMSMDVTLTGAE